MGRGIGREDERGKERVELSRGSLGRFQVAFFFFFSLLIKNVVFLFCPHLMD